MIYLIGQLSLWLLLAAAFAALAGWAFAARRNAPAERALRRERDNLLRDLAAMALGEPGAANDEAERLRSDEARRALADTREARIAELEQALEHARSRADESTSAIAELQRRVERADVDARELDRLRKLEEAREQERLVDVQVDEPEPDQQDVALQAWRLRYFEQRVRYLEGLGRPEPAAPVGANDAAEPSHAAETAEPSALLAADWRARDAEARAAFLENQLREQEAPLADAAETPFAANADVDMLLRWRLLYLEKRVAHLQTQTEQGEAAQVPAAVQPLVTEATPDPDRWKWRARYLEARVRHLEQRTPLVAESETRMPIAADEEPEPAPPPPPSDQPRRKPAMLSSPRNGAPDDLTLIEGVSAMQQSTLYSIGVFHFDQIAAWTPENVAWIDNYLRLRGRVDDEEWVEQAATLALELAHS